MRREVACYCDLGAPLRGPLHGMSYGAPGGGAGGGNAPPSLAAAAPRPLALLPPAPFRFEGGLRGASFDLGLAPGVPCRPGVLIEPSPNGLIGSSYGTDVAWKGDAGLSRSTIANCSPKDRGLTMDGSVG